MGTAAARWRRSGVVAACLAFMATVSTGAASASPRTGTAPQAAAAVQLAAPGACPSIMPLAHVHKGQVGTGWTVVRGNRPRPFTVHILGVFPDGVAPGHDMIIIRVADVPGSHFISRAGGIWAGMSGSPVYVNGKLVGSVSFGFTASPSPVGGMTPAEDMLKVLRYGTAAPASGDFGLDHTALPQSTRAQIAREAGITEEQASTFDRLRLPLAVSGLSARGRDMFQKILDKDGYQVIVTPGSSSPAPSGSSTYGRPRPGGNFAGLLSYGDVTSGGIGTTTYVCGGQALAFGHPLNLAGRANFGANGANSLAIVRDSTFGSFKLATIGRLFGTLDQDRLAGVRAHLGTAPRLIPIVADVTALDSGHERIGETDATTASILPGIAPAHLFYDIVSATDSETAGSSLVRWTVRGHDGNGNAWTLERTNRFAALDDIAFASVFELSDDLGALLNNPFTDVTFNSVHVDASVTATIKALSIEKVLVSKNGGAFKNTTSLTLHPGDTLRIRVTLRRYHGDTKVVDLSLTVPQGAVGGGALLVQGGSGNVSPCLFNPCGTTFQKLLDSLAGAPRNNDLSAALDLFTNAGDIRTAAQDTRHLGGVVSGNREINVIINP
jgi:hypothetical protein